MLSHILQLLPGFLNPLLQVLPPLVLLLVPEALSARDRTSVPLQRGWSALTVAVGDGVIGRRCVAAVASSAATALDGRSAVAALAALLCPGKGLEVGLEETLASAHQIHVLGTAQ